MLNACSSGREKTRKLIELVQAAGVSSVDVGDDSMLAAHSISKHVSSTTLPELMKASHKAILEWFTMRPRRDVISRALMLNGQMGSYFHLHTD